MISTNSTNEPSRRPLRARLAAAAFGLAAIGAPIALPAASVSTLALLAAPEPALAADAAGATEFARRIGEQVIATLNDPSLDRQARVAELIELLNAATNIDLIGKLVVGKHWRSLSDSQKSEYLGAFRELVMATVANRLDEYDGSTFEILGATEANRHDTVVHMMIKRPTGSGGFDVDWRVRDRDGDFALIDVVAGGISLIVTQRSEFSAVIDQRGFDGLIAELKNRASATAG